MRGLFCVVVLAAGLVSAAAAGPAAAQDFTRVQRQGDFVNLVAGKSLTRFGIRLMVRPDGGIEGSAFGKTVRGAWNWNGQYFCRDLSFGTTDLGPNCQAVLVRGDVLRFISDRGAGEYADLRLR